MRSRAVSGPLLATLIFGISGLSGCGQGDSPLPATNIIGTRQIAAPGTFGCANPLVYSEVPASWVPIGAPDFRVADGRGLWELVLIRVHGQIVHRDGAIASAAARFIVNRDRNGVQAEPIVDCVSMGPKDRMRFRTHVPPGITADEGAYQARFQLDFTAGPGETHLEIHTDRLRHRIRAADQLEGIRRCSRTVRPSRAAGYARPCSVTGTFSV